jgi:hypothetical protein
MIDFGLSLLGEPGLHRSGIFAIAFNRIKELSSGLRIARFSVHPSSN